MFQKCIAKVEVQHVPGPGHFHMQHIMNASVYNTLFSRMLDRVVYVE